MKILYKSFLVLTIILLTGCSFKGSMGQPTEDDLEISQLQQTVEDFVEDNNNLEEKLENYQNAINEVVNNINAQENSEVIE